MLADLLSVFICKQFYIKGKNKIIVLARILIRFYISIRNRNGHLSRKGTLPRLARRVMDTVLLGDRN